MKKVFIDRLKDTLTNSEHNTSVTENGAVGYKTTGRKIVDLNFAVSSLRSRSDNEIVGMFADACAEDLNTAIIWLFFARDVRGGLGERRLFRVCMKYLANEFPTIIENILPLIAEYGRWDDLIELIGTKVEKRVHKVIVGQLLEDCKCMAKGEGVSLLGKWMPSKSASSRKTKEKALLFQRVFDMTPKEYRKLLSSLRAYINVIERKMSSNKWSEIDYEAVPSRANLLYNKAFLRRDEHRRREYLGKLEKGESKINSSVLFPHDIVHKYNGARQQDPALEGMWKALPNTLDSCDSCNGLNTIVVADGSGSMTSVVGGGSSVTCLEVANALAIYFAERLSGSYKDKYITFSERPQLVDLCGASSLQGKLQIALRHNEVANTNIEAVFDLILETAIRNHSSQEDLPQNILVISDMEFDGCATSNDKYGSFNNKLFKAIERKYLHSGYKVPRLVFWNVCSRTNTIPVKENELGVALISGFSPNVAKMVMSGELDPLNVLLATLNSPRYEPIRKALAA